MKLKRNTLLATGWLLIVYSTLSVIAVAFNLSLPSPLPLQRDLPLAEQLLGLAFYLLLFSSGVLLLYSTPSQDRGYGVVPNAQRAAVDLLAMWLIGALSLLSAIGIYLLETVHCQAGSCTVNLLSPRYPLLGSAHITLLLLLVVAAALLWLARVQSHRQASALSHFDLAGARDQAPIRFALRTTPSPLEVTLGDKRASAARLPERDSAPVFASAAAERFWEAWQWHDNAASLGLLYHYQDPVTGYVLDFAHPPAKVAVAITERRSTLR